MTVTTEAGRQTTRPAVGEPWSAPLTESQLGLLVVHRSIPVPHLYNVVVELRLDPAVSPIAVRRALGALLEVQPALRLALRDARAVLCVPPSLADLPLRHVTVDGEFAPRVVSELDDLTVTAFHLEHAPLLRAHAAMHAVHSHHT